MRLMFQVRRMTALSEVQITQGRHFFAANKAMAERRRFVDLLIDDVREYGLGILQTRKSMSRIAHLTDNEQQALNTKLNDLVQAGEISMAAEIVTFRGSPEEIAEQMAAKLRGTGGEPARRGQKVEVRNSSGDIDTLFTGRME